MSESSQLKENIRLSFKKACLKRLDGDETTAVSILQEELPPLIKQWQSSDDYQAGEIEEMLAEELKRNENAHFIVKEIKKDILTQAQAEAMQSVLTAQLQLGLNAIKEKLQQSQGELVTYQGVEALGGRISQELSARVCTAVAELSQKSLSDVAKKADLEAITDQIKKALIANIDAKLNAADEMTLQQRNLVKEQLQKLVSAETFESRLMASVTMLHEAQSKALQDAVASIEKTVEVRLAQTTSPIYQRVSSLITFSDYERVAQQTNEKFASILSSQIEESINDLGNALVKNQGELTGLVTERTEAMLMRLQDIYSYLEQEKTQSQNAIADTLKNIGERLATLVIESAEAQKQTLGAVQKELTQTQTQSLGLLSVQQQNFMGGLQRDWSLLNKTLEEISNKQKSLEADLQTTAGALAMVAEQLRQMQESQRAVSIALPQSMQEFQKQIDSRLREQAQLTQAELNALHRRLETGLAETFAKRLKALRVVAE